MPLIGPCRHIEFHLDSPHWSPFWSNIGGALYHIWCQILLTYIVYSKYKTNLKPVTCRYRLPIHFAWSHHQYPYTATEENDNKAYPWLHALFFTLELDIRVRENMMVEAVALAS